MQHQGEEACTRIQNNPRLANLTYGFDLVAFSQGTQLARYVVEACPVKVRKLVTFGGPLTGQSAIENCPEERWSCFVINKLFDIAAYVPYSSNILGPFGYWRAPWLEGVMKFRKTYLALMNNQAYHTFNETFR